MKIACIQMDTRPADPDRNIDHACRLIREAARRERPDVVVLPELWDVGFFPREGLRDLCDADGRRTRGVLGGLARELGVDLVAGSVADLRDGRVYNTAYVFDRAGDCVYRYDKAHLFSPSGEPDFFAPGDRCGVFRLDGVTCGLILCYDLRFPELTRSLRLRGADLLFIPAQWPAARLAHLETLTRARAIENQMFTVLANSCADGFGTVCAGHSALIDPWGVTLAAAGAGEEIIAADLRLEVLEEIRSSINVFRDRRPELYGAQG